MTSDWEAADLGHRARDGKGSVETPDLMRWQIWDVGTRTGSMQNALSRPQCRQCAH